MTRTWTEAIYDRIYWDVQSAQYNPDQENPKGCWNAIDLNRIEQNTAYCAEYMLENKIVRTPPNITVRENDYWQANMIPSKTEIDRIINNVGVLINASKNNPAIVNLLPTTYPATQINYIFANQIEYALEVMHNQPKLPLEYWTVNITNGVIKSVVRASGTTEIVNSDTALVAEDEIVTIRGVEYGQYAQYQLFTNWSGTPADIGLLDDYDSQETTFIMPYRNVSFTANFETHLPRTLTITNGYISVNNDPTASSGPSTGTYYAGDQIMIIANVGPDKKRFYEWTGTQAGVDNIVGVTEAEDPSAAILTMPDCDVNLAPHYINALKPYVTVNGGTGSGYYDYNDYVTISATVPSHYQFAQWSVDTGYLNDIYSSVQTFRIGDTNATFTAIFTYVYSYNSVQMIDGLIRVNGNDLTLANNLRQDTSYTLIPTPPDNTQGLDYWEVEGLGRVSGNTFTVGDGNAIITGHYAPYRTLTVDNINNNSGTNTYTIVQGHSQRLTTTASTGNYRFNGWYENNSRISTSTTLDVTMGVSDRTIEARYDYYETYTVTLINKNNSGQTTTSQVLSGDYWSNSTNEEVGDYLLVGWRKDGTLVNTTTNYGFTVTSNTTVEVEYREKETYHLTVNNGTGSGDYKERQSVTITADEGDFSNWSYSGLYSIANANSRTTTVKLGRGDGTVTANFNMRTITVITNSGSNTYNIMQDSYRDINSGTAPASYEFNHWEVTSGDATLANMYASGTRVYAHTQDSTVTAVYSPIPTFTVTMIDGYVWNGSDWVTSATLLRNSTNAIKLKQGSVPLGYQFLQWEVYVNGVLQTNSTDINAPYAETTRLQNLTRNITIKATFFQPDQEEKYVLTIRRKDGSSTQIEDITVGTNVTVNASTPDTGYEFYKWTGDTAYVTGGIYNSTTYVHMPAQNVQIEETYVPEGYIPEFDLVMTNIYGQCCYTTEYEDPETHETITTDHWVSRWTYPEGTEVRIRITNVPNDSYFDAWTALNHDTNADARSIIDSISSPTTTLIMPNYDVDIQPEMAPKQTYQLRVNDGGTSGYYYEGDRADIYFNKVNTNDVHYQFTRWTGSTVSQLELYTGGMFSVLTPTIQYIKMPGQATEVTATYKTLYRLTLTNGTIDVTGAPTEGYYETGTTLNITADPAPTGMRFQYWSGEISRIGNKYDPTTTITTTTGTTNITAIYSTDADRNEIGYVTTDLKSVNSIDNNNVTIISGEIEVGFIITDINGHIYVVTSVDTQNNTSTIYRMTKVVEGGNVYG